MRSRRKQPPMSGDEGERGIPDGPDAEEPVDEEKRGGRPKKKTGGHAEGSLEAGRADRRPRRASGGKWISGAIKHPGALHEELHVPKGEPIPEKKLEKAAHSENPTLRRRANLAKTLKSFH